MSGLPNHGGPAFPTAPTTRDTVHVGADGMLLRDYFAAAALPAIITATASGNHSPDFREDEPASNAIARDAYTMADAMLKAREAS